MYILCVKIVLRLFFFFCCGFGDTEEIVRNGYLESAIPWYYNLLYAPPPPPPPSPLPQPPWKYIYTKIASKRICIHIYV